MPHKHNAARRHHIPKMSFKVRNWPAYETTMGHYKAPISPRLRARDFTARQTEAAIGVAVLNQMLAAGRPKSIPRQRVIA
jgi:hypothetical protein